MAPLLYLSGITEYGTCRPFDEEAVKLFSVTKDGLSYDTDYPDGRGLLTGTATYEADGSGARLSLKALYYDSRTQVVQERELNHRGELVERFAKFSFTGMQEAAKTRYGNTEEDSCLVSLLLKSIL